VRDPELQVRRAVPAAGGDAQGGGEEDRREGAGFEEDRREVGRAGAAELAGELTLAVLARGEEALDRRAARMPAIFASPRRSRRSAMRSVAVRRPIPHPLLRSATR